MSRPASIAATLIVRNEARCLARCLTSVACVVDRMVVVDTGSTDDTVAIAKAAGAEVHRLPWPDDFAAARNHALTCSDADWNLVIDADEWIVAGGEALRDFCAGPPQLGRICIASDTQDGTGNARNWITRILPRGVRFEGRVHEQVASSLPRVRVPLHVGHDGYLAEHIAEKRDRNHMLLLRELAEQPDDAYLLYQLGKDAQMRADLPAACDYFTRALAATPAQANWRHALVTTAIPLMSQAGRLNDALTLANAEFGQWPDSPDYFFVLGDVLLDQALADPAQAVGHWLPLAQAAWEQCLTIGERPELDGSVTGRGSHLARHNLEVIRAQLKALAA
ncbi:glycosyltransferase [Sphingomonas sp. NPDC019816]|uniref:glycosyltransferase n=1 Tax=Sphingomonas sp. NPDC019816 TaxID=3390679 RepID=UPI003CFC60EC